MLSFNPAPTYAGFFGYVMHYSSEKKALSNENSQKIALLEAIPHPKGAFNSRGNGEITIVGGSALLPESGPQGTLADIEPSEHTSDQISVYVVREGDTLSEVAEMFGVSINTIIWANNISRGSSIAPGETLVILPVTGVRHVVKSGDTIKGLASKYDGDVEEILNYNSLSLSVGLTVGDVITIPDGVISTPKASPSKTGGSSAPSYAGYYLRPIAGGVRTQGIHGYNGVDLATYAGAPIYAAASGEVIISKEYGWNSGYGNYVVIKHPNGTQTLYAHNTSNAVGVGDYVAQGQVVGYVGTTGKSTGNHVHFEVRGAKNPF